MPTKHRRITVTRGGELSAALARVRDLVPQRHDSAIVHAMALKGIEATLAERDRRAELVERFIARITSPDWPYASDEEAAWVNSVERKLPRRASSSAGRSRSTRPPPL